MEPMWEKMLVPVMPESRLVVSETGDILSPKYAPDTMAPAVSPVGKPRASPTPSRARPAVPMVPKEVPVMREKTAQMSTVLTRNMEGERSFRPQ